MIPLYIYINIYILHIYIYNKLEGTQHFRTNPPWIHCSARSSKSEHEELFKEIRFHVPDFQHQLEIDQMLAEVFGV